MARRKLPTRIFAARASVAGSGSVNAAGASVTGAGALASPIATLDGAGQVGRIAAGALAAQAAQVDGTSGGTGVIDYSIIPADRRTSWNPGIYGGIPPDNAVLGVFPNGVGPAIQHGATIAAGASVATIQSALNAAGAVATKASRRFVQLGPGTFTISSGLSIPSYVILRGTSTGIGNRQTTLNITYTGGNCIEIGGSHNGWGTLYQVQGTLKRGDSTITLNTVAGLNVGDLIKLDHLADGTLNGTDVMTWSTIQIQGETNYRANTGNVTRNWDDTPGQTGACVFGNSSLSFARCRVQDGNYQFFPDSPGGWRFISETKEILAINGNTITIAQPMTGLAQSPTANNCGAPIRMWYYRSPEVYRCAGVSGTSAEYAGLENVRVLLTGKPIGISNAKFCWIKNVETDGAAPGKTHKDRHIFLYSHSYRCEVMGCYVHNQADYHPGGAYGLNITGSDHYIHNNVAINHNKPINFEASNGGTVVAYNYVDNAIIQDDPGWQESGIGTHASFCHHELVEGNQTPNVTIDSTHGNNGFMVAFRNHLRGRNTFVSAPSSHAGASTGALRRAVMSDFLNWEVTSIGNVCYEPTRTAPNVTAFSPQTRWYNLTQSYGHACYVCGFNGWSNTRDTFSQALDDGFAASHLHYHMDRQHTSGGSPLYQNPSNPVTALPASLHRTAAPDYFSGYTWPPIDPTQSTFGAQVATLPAKARLDAGTP